MVIIMKRHIFLDVKLRETTKKQQYFATQNLRGIQFKTQQ